MKSRRKNLTPIQNFGNQKYPNKRECVFTVVYYLFRQLWGNVRLLAPRRKRVVQPDAYQGTSETLKKLQIENRTQQNPTHAAGIPPVTYSFLVFSESPLHRFLRSKLYKGIPCRSPHRVSHDCYTIGYNLQPC